MPGYEIMEIASMQPYNPEGIVPYEIRIGFIDFLREIRNEANDIPRLSSYMVVGLEDVLFLTKTEERHSMARKIHDILQSGASSLQRKSIQVQITCKGRLMRGDTLWIDYRGERLDIELIFGSTTKQTTNGTDWYFTGFNLSS
ncbi:MAG: hypothetical protein A2Z47_05810 [Thermodesulfovibrio sp. RBG_19FT_COMBO_42_12]|nr:MAG: hypothetical protein A2Z47_05810 [Thermodesulfovibrio sp. RBG_19FT_COMBO_42_12]HZX48550.1 hypothetical protein [Nitrospirota bacterium]